MAQLLIKNFLIEPIYKTSVENEALLKEKYFIRKLKTKNSKFGYNLTDGGDGVSGYKHTKKDLVCKSLVFEKRLFFGSINLYG